MSSLSNYFRLSKHIKNWRLYFKRNHEKKEIARYITKGKNLEFDVPPNFFFVFKEIFMEDFYHINDLLTNIPNNATIIDIGCNAGYFSFITLSKKKDAKVYAYDPMKVNIELFEHNIKLNDGLSNQIKVFNKAVTGTEQGNITLFFDDVENDSVIASIYNDFSEKNNNSISVETISLKKIIEENSLTKIDLLKLDCEGSEYPILYNSPNEVWNFINALTIETHELDEDDKNSKNLIKFLQSKNFKLEMHKAENDCFSIRAYKN